MVCRENTVKEEVLCLVKRGISFSFVTFGMDVQPSFAMQSAPLVEWTGGSIVHVNNFFSQSNINAVGSADTIIEQVAEKVILSPFATVQLSIVTSPKFKVRRAKMQHPHGTFHRASSSDTTEAQSTSIIVKHKRFHDHMEQWISSRCDNLSAFPIYFEFDAAGGFDERWCREPTVQVIFEYSALNTESGEVERRMRIFTQRFDVADDLAELYSSVNLYNTFSIMAHQVSIEHSVQAESKETLQHLLVDFVIRLITQFTKQITQSLEKSIRNVGGVRESITTGSLEGLLRLFYGLIQSVFLKKLRVPKI